MFWSNNLSFLSFVSYVIFVNPFSAWYVCFCIMPRKTIMNRRHLLSIFNCWPLLSLASTVDLRLDSIFFLPSNSIEGTDSLLLSKAKGKIFYSNVLHDNSVMSMYGRRILCVIVNCCHIYFENFWFCTSSTMMLPCYQSIHMQLS